MKKRILSALLVCVMLIGLVPMVGTEVNALETFVINGKTYSESNLLIANNCSCGKAIGTEGHVCCYEYTQKIFNKFWGRSWISLESDDLLYGTTNMALNATNVEKVLRAADPGAHFRMTRSNETGYGHSLVFLKLNSSGNGAWVINANCDAKGNVKIQNLTWQEIVNVGSWTNSTIIWFVAWPDGASYKSRLNNAVPHTCNFDGGYIWYLKSHPHYNCYKCSICGEVHEKRDETNIIESCDDCRNIYMKPGKPVLNGIKSSYINDTTVKFEWDSTVNTTHYNLYIHKKTSTKTEEWEVFEIIHYAESGLTRSFPVGQYRAQLQSTNSNYWTPDNSTWEYTDGDWVYFDVVEPHITHSYSLVSEIPSTCSASGSRTYVCSVCGNTYSETISALDHNYIVVEYIPHTCRNSGSCTYACSVCGDTYSETISPIGHHYNCTVTDPTCTETGLKTWKCASCGDVLPSETIPALGHDYQFITTIDPSCASVGYTIYKCSRCNDTYTETQLALGHNFVNGVCTRCGEKEGSSSFLRGDINGDGKLNSRDIIALMRIAIEPDPEISSITDITGDGKLNARDIVALMKLVLEQV